MGMSYLSFHQANEIGLSVVIPCFQSELTIETVVRDLQNTLKECGLTKFEILMVLDGPTDGTKKIAQRLEIEFTESYVVELTRNFGQHAAIFAGIYCSKYDLILTLDDDGQHPPSAVPLLIQELNSDTDVVYGIPREYRHHFLRNYASRFFKHGLFYILGLRHSREISALRLFRKSLLQDVDLQKFSVGIIDVALQWSTTRISAVILEISERSAGKSNYTFRTLISLAIRMIIGYSIKPLKWALYLGVVTLALSVTLAIYFILQYFAERVTLDGFVALAILLAIMSSIQLTILGILGEYLGSIHQKTIGKPMFNIRKSF